MGIAWLPDGRRMEYENYLHTPEWKKQKADRLAFDNWMCGICHKPLTDKYETHHLNYSRLGHEDIEKDLISLCNDCHKTFHELWDKKEYWTRSPLQHWKDFDLVHTCKFCIEYLHEDYMFGGDYNFCSSDVVFDFIDRYYTDHMITEPVHIDENDIKLYFRNKRYEIFFDTVGEGRDLEEVLDEMFGKKGGKGGNPKRAAARSFFTKHKLPAMKRIYKENENVNILMMEIFKLKHKGEKTNE